MSIQAMSWVLDHSRTTGATRLVMIGIANHVDARGEGWAYVAEVLRTANVSEKSYYRSVAEAKEMGELQVDARAGGSLKMRGDRRPNMFRFPGLAEAYEDTQSRPPQDDHPVEERPPQDDSHEVVRMTTTDSGTVIDPSTPLPPNDSPAGLFVVPDSVSPAATADTLETLALFEPFWNTFPRRNGKREGKAKALVQWRRMKPAQRADALAAVGHYAEACEAGRIAADAHRWLKDRRWDDWQEPEQRPEAGDGRPRDVPADAVYFNGSWMY